MNCPHCLTAFFDNHEITELGEDSDFKWALIKRQSPTCGKFIFSIYQKFGRYNVGGGNRYHYNKEFYCYPKAPNRMPLPPEVPEEYVVDYQEACLTLTDSPNASAALSRRCLQHILREVANVRRGNLADEIQQILDEGKMPSHLLESLVPRII